LGKVIFGITVDDVVDVVAVVVAVVVPKPNQ
jgi:hypothetical protein